MTFDTLQKINLHTTKGLKVSNGHFKVDIALWLVCLSPASIKDGRLLLRYFDGKGFKTKTLDEIKLPVGENTLLSARVSLPVALQRNELEIGVAIEGSRYKVDKLHWSPIVEPVKQTANSLHAA